MAGRRTYNEHLLYSDPFSKSVANRTTRFRRKRERNAMVVNDIAPNGATENAIESCDMIYDATSSFQADFQSQEQTICSNHMNTMMEEVESVEQELQDTMTVHGESMESQRSYYTDTELQENSEQEELFTETAYLLGDFYAFHSEEVLDSAAPEEDLSSTSDDGLLCDSGAETVLNSSSVDTDQPSSVPTDPDSIMPSNPVLFNGCPLSLSTSTILIKKFQIRHKLSQEALSDMLELMKLHFPVTNHFPRSLHLFNKELPFNSNGLEFVYFCSHCFSEIAESAESCIHCNRLLSDKASISSFIEVPLQSQLITLLQSAYTIIANQSV